MYYADSWISWHPSGSEVGQVVRPLFGPSTLSGLGGSLPVSISGGGVSVTSSIAINVSASIVASGTVQQGDPGTIDRPWFFTPVSGGLYVGTLLNPFYVTGALGLSEGVSVKGTVQVAASAALPVTGALKLSEVASVTGSVGISAPVTVLQGTVPWVISGSAPIDVDIKGGVTVNISASVPLTASITGSVSITEAIDVKNKTFRSARVYVTGSGFSTVVPAVPGRKIKVYAFAVQLSGTTSDVSWSDGTTVVAGPYAFGDREGLGSGVCAPALLFSSSVGVELALSSSTASRISGFLSYYDDDNV